MRGSYNSRDPNVDVIVIYINARNIAGKTRFTSKVFITRFNANRIKFRDIDDDRQDID